MLFNFNQVIIIRSDVLGIGLVGLQEGINNRMLRLKLLVRKFNVNCFLAWVVCIVAELVSEVIIQRSAHVVGIKIYHIMGVGMTDLVGLFAPTLPFLR